MINPNRDVMLLAKRASAAYLRKRDNDRMDAVAVNR